MGKGGIDVEAELDALYGGPLAEFVAARNALGKRLDAAGRKDDAARVKALKKPGAAAWAVNRLAIGSPRLVEALVATGDRLRAKPSAAKDSMAGRREALNAARHAAEKALAEGGHAATPELMRRVSATLEAIAAYGSAKGRPAAGRLTEDVPAPGFDEIAALGLLGGAGPRRVAPAAPPPQASRTTQAPERRPSPAPEPKRGTARDRARAAALEDKRRREATQARAARAKAAREAESRERAAEKALDALRRKKTSLETALSEAAAEERTLDAALAEARKAAAAARAAADGGDA